MISAFCAVFAFASAARASTPEASTLGLQSAYLGVLSTGAMAALWMLPADKSQWYAKPPLTADGLYHRWRANLAAGPAWDGDMRFFNSYGHIHSGAAYAVMCLENGYSELACTAYANAASVLWEYGPEAIIEVPSYQDLMMTGLVGARVGIRLFAWKRALAARDGMLLGSRALGSVAGFALDPFGSMTRGLVRLVHGRGTVTSSGAPTVRVTDEGKPALGYTWNLRW